MEAIEIDNNQSQANMKENKNKLFENPIEIIHRYYI